MLKIATLGSVPILNISSTDTFFASATLTATGMSVPVVGVAVAGCSVTSVGCAGVGVGSAACDDSVDGGVGVVEDGADDGALGAGAGVGSGSGAGALSGLP